MLTPWDHLYRYHTGGSAGEQNTGLTYGNISVMLYGFIHTSWLLTSLLSSFSENFIISQLGLFPALHDSTKDKCIYLIDGWVDISGPNGWFDLANGWMAESRSIDESGSNEA